MNLINNKNKAIFDKILTLEDFECSFKIADCIEITAKTDKDLQSLAAELKPWRKGPFKINEIFIDSEWRSFIKFNLLKPHLDLNQKTVADIGCNNGYYMFRILEFNPKKIIGFDPGVIFFLQFKFINHFIKSNIKFELLGVQDLRSYGMKFDTIFCLGVIYHRSDPIGMLKELKFSLNSGGEVFLDTMFIQMQGEFALTPKDRYSKISNIYFIPTIQALQNWCQRAGFKNFEILAIKDTDLDEQRKTQWIQGQSLESFLNPLNPNLTIEGYPAPKRVYVKIS